MDWIGIIIAIVFFIWYLYLRCYYGVTLDRYNTVLDEKIDVTKESIDVKSDKKIEDIIEDKTLTDNDKELSMTEKVNRSALKCSKGEKACKIALKEIFNRDFTTVRPWWLLNNETGKRMEIDCYNEEIEDEYQSPLGVEYDGIQHRLFTERFHKTSQDHIDQKRRDELKDKICKERGVMLIRVPDTVKIDDIKSYLITQLKTYMSRRRLR